MKETIWVPEEIKQSKKLPCVTWCEGNTGLEQQASIIKTVGNDPGKVMEAMEFLLDQGVACKCGVCSRQLLKMSEALSYHGAVLSAKGRGDLEAMLFSANRRGKIYKELGHTVI